MSKKPFVTKEQVEEIVKTYPTPFHLYDVERNPSRNAKALKEAFSWNPGYKRIFCSKGNSKSVSLLDILKEYGCGCDCSYLYGADALRSQ